MIDSRMGRRISRREQGEDVFAPAGEGEKRPPEVLFQVFVLVWVAVEVLAFAAEPPAA